MIELSQQRFDALAGYTRRPEAKLLLQEAAWFSADAERLLGLITWDRQDQDFGWIILGRDQRLCFRAISAGHSLPSFNIAREKLSEAISHYSALPDEAYHQGDKCGPPVDFFNPIGSPERFDPIFRTLLEDAGYSPAREIIAAMMRFHEDADGNFIEQFQTIGFNQRLWELYLFATFNELGYARRNEVAVPDFLLTGIRGQLAVEATTMNAPDTGDAPQPKDIAAERDYMENYVPLKIARALERKLKKRYWMKPGIENIPFVIALQDFHAPGSMSLITKPATEYVFGVRHSIVQGKQRIERLTRHTYSGVSMRSNFFELPEAENVSAVMINPLGTISKFNRMGCISRFGDRRVKMVHSGWRRGEVDPAGPGPLPFEKEVHTQGYHEQWIEGAVILHNPKARVPLNPHLVPGANHEFLQSDGTITSLLPDFHPYTSRTIVWLDDIIA